MTNWIRETELLLQSNTTENILNHFNKKKKNNLEQRKNLEIIYQDNVIAPPLVLTERSNKKMKGHIYR